MQPCECLTTKEMQVATLVWEGLTNRQIAAIIGTSEQVVKNYLRTTFDKLGVWSRLELALYVARQGVQVGGIHGTWLRNPLCSRTQVVFCRSRVKHSCPMRGAPTGGTFNRVAHYPRHEGRPA